MGVIQKLDSKTINQIAAGEVIERPSSIVKELVENSIDADATAITVEIENGGITLIRVTDNGVGMQREDAESSFQRHATSKILKADDLNHIQTLGFRGEALASIAAVTQIEMLTRPRGEISGSQIVNHGGHIIKVSEVGCPEGTTVLVRNLFYNTPARLKFLKSTRSETAAVSDLLAKLILANPQISIKYISNGKTIYHSPGNDSLFKAIISIYGKDITNQLILVEANPGHSFYVSGYIGKPSLNMANRKHQSFFVNKRYVNCSFLSQCLEEALKEQTMINRFPWCVLNIKLPVQEVDVNVHPSKTDIRFRTPLKVKQLLTAIIRDAVKNQPDIPQLFPDLGYERKEPSEVVINEEKNIEVFCKTEQEKPSRQVYIHRESQEEIFPSSGMNGEENDNTIDAYEFTKLNIIGSAFSTFILVESDKQLYIIDQHAAHERLIYEQYKESIKNQKVLSQQMLPPYILEVTHDEFIAITDNLDIFLSVGFEMEPFGGKTFLIRGLPVVLKEADVREIFNEILAHTNKANRELLLQEEDIIKISCKKAVKANDKLSQQEIRGLLKDLEQKRIPLTCPHGRPIMISMSRYELEKRFKRV
ncbi:MAG: DNA mismatch repair endonuclease MutL [Caldicoprobacterales bacterium]|jgi:DNA mismatch repair protein MutL|nr:DNA mismatch repair endonuclease MutL [Clostridiales bacterium]